MSASPPRADMLSVGINVCKVPEADVSPHSVLAMNSMSSWQERTDSERTNGM